MNRNIRYRYYVEGECEKKLVDTLKANQMIISGKSEVFNPVQDYFNYMHIRTLPQNSIIILIFDTDKKETSALVRNLEFLRGHSFIKEVLCIPQILNLEDEILRSTNIKHIRDFFNCKRDSEFKQKFLEEKQLFQTPPEKQKLLT